MLALVLILAAGSRVGVLNPFQGLFLAITRPFEEALGSVFSPVAGLLGSAGELDSIRDENARLRIENERLVNENATLAQQAARVEELEAALGIAGTRRNEVLLPANVVSEDASPFTHVISIDAGEGNGIRTGMVVLSPKGTLVGTVTDVRGGRAFVRVISDSKSKVAATTLETGFDGIVQGTPGRGLEFTLSNGDLKVGDTIVTSSLTGRFPAGIPIGKVTEISGDPQDVNRPIRLEPLYRISNVKTVLVITSFRPGEGGTAQP